MVEILREGGVGGLVVGSFRYLLVGIFGLESFEIDWIDIIGIFVMIELGSIFVYFNLKIKFFRC